MELKPGYKQTELGPIPEDWEEVALGDLFEFKNGLNKAKGYFGSGTPIVNYMDVYNHAALKADDILGRVTVSKEELDAYSAKRGDVFFTRTSETAEEVGIASVLLDDVRDTVFSGFVLRARPKKSVLSDNFKKYCFSSGTVRNQIVSKSTYTTRALTNGRTLSSVMVPVPTADHEQEAIAEALGDIDHLTQSFEQLISKKRKIKRGAMRELLTGRRRLPGFSDDWTLKEIGEFTDCVAGGTPSTKIAEYWGGIIPWMNSGELNLKSVRDVEGRITAAGLRNSNTRLLPQNCVLVGLAGQGRTRGTVAMNFVPLCTNQSIAAILPNEGFVSRYLYYNLDLRYEELRELSAGDGGRGGLNLTIIRKVNIPLPSISEQEAIVSILTDMDIEIDSLEICLAKARRIRQGMMRELLTGTRRLVQSESRVLQFQSEERTQMTRKGHNSAIDEAVIISVLAKKFGSENYPLGRKRYTKLSYLFHRHAEGRTEGYLEKAAGPYNPSTKYKGAEKIALSNRYVRSHARDNFSGFVAAEKIAEAEGYFAKWYGDDSVSWLEQFRYKNNDELELLATVDMAMVKLREIGKQVSVASVKQYLHDAPEWTAKLGRSIFADENIDVAIKWSEQLFES